jgi:RimJ/RimL family protein N-acetyltransferase
MPDELHSERLRLRPLAATDREPLHRHWTDADVRRFLWDDVVIDLATVDGVIERSGELLATQGFSLNALERLGGEALVGVCGLYQFPDLEPELIYSLSRPHWGQGLATEASRVVIADAFERLGFTRVLARTDTPNRASVHVMERLGMQFEGESVENGLPTLRYVLEREAWEASR